MKKILVGLLTLSAMVGILLYPPDPLLEKLIDLERWRLGVTHKIVQVDGETWHYLEGGEENAETIVLIHGFGADKDNWMRFAAHLVQDYRVIAPDLPGWGESARHADWDYRLPEQVARLKMFTDALGLPPFHLAGNSMGGHTTALFGAAYPQNVLTLGLFNAAGVTAPKPSERILAAREGKNLLVIDSVADYDRLIAFASYEPPFIPPPAKRYMAKRALEHREFNDHIFWQLTGDYRTPLEPKLPLIQTPALVLWGDTDRLIDVSSTQVFARLLPNNEVVIMEKTGHLPMVERPAEAAEIYQEFIAKHASK